MMLLAELTVHLENPSAFELFGVHHFLGLDLALWTAVVMCLLIAGGLILATRVATRNMQDVPGRMQAGAELLVEGLRNFFTSILGAAAPRYIPFLSCLFIYILVMNYLALVPGMMAATSKLSTTAALALITFAATQIEGVRAHGILGYLKHFAGDFPDFPLVGKILMGVFMFPLHIIGELARPLSLSFRLFGNIMGEDTLLAVIVSFGAVFFMLFPVPVPLHFPLLFLSLLAGLIQALVFALLSSIYIGGAVGAFDEHGAHGGGHGESHGGAHGHAEGAAAKAH